MNAKLRTENVNLKEKVHQYRKIVAEKPDQGGDTNESSIHEIPAAPVVNIGKRRPVRSNSNLSAIL